MSNSPNPDISPEELWASVTAMPRAHRIVPFPRFKPGTKEPICNVAMIVLTQGDCMLGLAAADRTTRKLLGDANATKNAKAAAANPNAASSTTTQGAVDIYRNASSIEVLWRACRNPNDLSKPFFPTREAIGLHLTTDEIGVLMNHYLETQVDLGPVISRMSDAEVEEWIDQLTKGGLAAGVLSFFSSEALRTLVRALASRLSPSTTDSTSRGSQPSDGSSESTTEETEADETTIYGEEP